MKKKSNITSHSPTQLFFNIFFNRAQKKAEEKEKQDLHYSTVVVGSKYEELYGIPLPGPLELESGIYRNPQKRKRKRGREREREREREKEKAKEKKRKRKRKKRKLL